MNVKFKIAKPDEAWRKHQISIDDIEDQP